MASYYNENTIVWLNGTLVKAGDAKVDLYSQSLHYGNSVFEGIRSYRAASGETSIFKAKEHFDRLCNSAVHMNLPYDWTSEELTEYTYDVLRANNFQDAYIRPLLYAPANMSFVANTQSSLTILAWEMQPFLGDKLLKVCISSFQRPNPRAFRIEAKSGGHYVNSLLASQEAKANGFDEALLTDMNGHIAEAPGANVFFERNGKLFTPAPGHILAGITRSTVLEICHELNIPVEEARYDPNDMKGADAAFFCGTAAEVIGLQLLDDVPFLKKWEDTLSSQIQQAYKHRVIGKIYKPILQPA